MKWVNPFPKEITYIHIAEYTFSNRNLYKGKLCSKENSAGDEHYSLMTESSGEITKNGSSF